MSRKFRSRRGAPEPALKAIRCRFTFSVRPSEDLITAEPVLLAQSPWHEVAPIQPGMGYTVKFELDRPALEWFRTLMDDVGNQ